MSRALLGRERTKARRAVAILQVYDPALVARTLGLKKHTVAAILSLRMLPGRRVSDAVRRFAAI